jgi:VIT1/CCC1 family predicted Fe2+/Mn2+ transporter
VSSLDSWREEKQSAWLYRELADCEPDPKISNLFKALAAAAEGQAEKWRVESGGTVPAFAPSTRARITATLARKLGPRRVKPILVAMKVRGVSAYGGATPAPGHKMPTSASQAEMRHRGYGGGNLRAAVFGVNDGLVSNTSLIMGVAGASAGLGAVITSGVAGLLAGALSMAAGEYISMRSQREMFEYQIGLERDELDEYPEEEAEELALIYNARGMDLEEARRITRDLVKNHDAALDALAREELGLNPDDLGSPWGAAIFSFLAFSAGAILPLVPFFFGLPLGRAVIVAAVIAGIALFGVGAALSLFTGRNAWVGGLRMVAIGGGAGIVTWFIGSLLGAAIS